MTIMADNLGGTDATNGPANACGPVNDTFNLVGGILGSSTGNQMPPVGSLAFWLKTLTGTPALLAGWVECDGSVLSDADSVFNGETLPNLNDGATFLRGCTTSGGTGGTATHAHTLDAGDFRPTWNTDATTDTVSNIPPYYEVVIVMRVK